MRIKRLITSIILCVIAICTQAATPLDDFLDGLETLQADFVQTVTSDNRRASRTSSGTFYLSRPGRFRWNYSDPKGQQIVADGHRVWLYDPDLLQVSHQAQADALRGTPAQLLSGTDPIEQHFKVINIGVHEGINWIKLMPKAENSEIIEIDLGFSRQRLDKFEMVDAFGQVTKFLFKHIQRNPKLPPRLFNFRTPPEADILQR